MSIHPDYQQFLDRKRIIDPMTGLATVPALPDAMFAFQRDITSWTLRRGRAALFAGTGLGKTFMELTWGHAVASETRGMILHLAPLAVAQQIIREATKWGVPARLVSSQADCGTGINVTNYQKLAHFDLSKFVGVILDESSILKSTDGHYRTKLIEACQQIPFRLAATATPAPNDFMELGNHAEFLGVMKYTDMLATFFTHDNGDTQKWRLKGHAENEFWKWMASWSVMLRRPSDLGYPDGAYNLPPLNQFQHQVAVDYAPSLETGMLFPMEAATLQERIGARRDTISERVALAATIVNGSLCDKLAACGSQNTRSGASKKPNKTRSSGLSATPRETALTPIGAPNICANIESGSLPSSSELPSSKSRSTLAVGSDTPQTLNIGSGQKHQPVEAPMSGAANCCDQTTNSLRSSTTQCSNPKTGCAPSAVEEPSNLGSTSIIATTPVRSEASSADHATTDLAGSAIASTDFLAPSNISSNLGDDPWLVWCQLNSEQDALEAAFKGRCISVRGSMTDEEKEAGILAWLRGDKPIMISKPSIIGFGLNFQHCNQMMFVGLNDSFEQVYQSIRRCWRFGQTKPVNVHFIAAETEGAVVSNLKRKESDAERMAAAMVMHTSSISNGIIRGMVRDRPAYDPQHPMIIPQWLEKIAC